MRNVTVILSLVIATILGCSNEPDSAQASEEKPAPAKAENKTAAGGEGPDCDTLMAEVRQACVDRYAKGVMVECDHFVSMASAYAAAVRTSHQTPEIKAKMAAKMCVRLGKELREARAGAETKPVAAACVELGKHLDSTCFRFIGDPAYPEGQCNGWLSSSRPLTDQACAFTTQFANALQGG